MTPAALFLILLSEFSSITGQLLFKLAVNETDESAKRRGKFLPIFAAGVVAMAIGFFAWVTLLSRFDLSYVYPFEALSRLMLIVGAVFFLKEKMTARLWVGAFLITVGIVVVSATKG